MKLDKRERNDIVEAYRWGGIVDADLRVAETDDAMQLRHVPTGSLFTLTFTLVDGHYRGSYETGDLGLPKKYDISDWSGVVDRVKGWAMDVKADAELPDLWAELLAAGDALSGSRYADAENAPLTADEHAQVLRLLAEVRDHAERTYELTAAQSLSLEAGFAEVRELIAAGRGRRELLLILKGVMVEKLADALLQQDVVLAVFTLALRGLDAIFGGGGGWPELPGPLGLPPST